jgi:aldehyde:ferredoxin oxidoreductase
MADLLNMGARIWLLMRGLTNLMGVRAKDDILPHHVMLALDNGMAAGSVPDLEAMRREYYALRGIDADGLPRKEVLEKAGLADLAVRLQGMR